MKKSLVFETEMVKEGSQNLFYRFLNPIRRKILIATSGELMFIRRDVLERFFHLKPAKQKKRTFFLEYGYKTIFCEDCYAETERTKSADKEEIYKRKTVTGIYQALSYCKPPFLIRMFYALLPLSSLLLLAFGKKGYYWMRGILLGFLDYA